jgi:hypothetical protein
MKKVIISIVLAVLLVGLLATPIFADGKSAMSGKSNNGHVYLYEKNAADWTIVEDGAWGKFNYKLSGSAENTEVSGVFNGHGLVVGTDYSLIYYKEVADWSSGGAAIAVLGNAVANEFGDVHIAGSGTIGMPDTQPEVGDYIGQIGDKIWLVLTADIDTDSINSWNPAEYLFEDELINAVP